MKKQRLKIFFGAVMLTLLLAIPPASAYSHEMQQQTNTVQVTQGSEENGPFGAGWYNKPTNYAQLISWYQ
ncbi:MAG: hypothetical protein WC525_08510, partial [Candidatus Thermoplasmatota archaeon]